MLRIDVESDIKKLSLIEDNRPLTQGERKDLAKAIYEFHNQEKYASFCTTYAIAANLKEWVKKTQEYTSKQAPTYALLNKVKLDLGELIGKWKLTEIEDLDLDIELGKTLADFNKIPRNKLNEATKEIREVLNKYIKM